MNDQLHPLFKDICEAYLFPQGKECKNKDPQGYCELSNNASGKCKDLRHCCEHDPSLRR